MIASALVAVGQPNGAVAETPTATATTPAPATATLTPAPAATKTPAPVASATLAKTQATQATQATVSVRPSPTVKVPEGGIAIQPITRTTSIKSYKTLIGMKLDGVSEGKVAKGDFNTEAQTLLATKKQSFALSGSAMSQLLGKYLRGLPVNKLTVYLFDKNSYIFAQSFLSVCAVPKTPIGGLDQLGSGLSAEALLASLTGSNTIYGTLLGDETVNGVTTRHYRLDVAKMNALASQNRVAASLRSGEVWLAKDGNFVVRLNANADGALAKATGVDFKGNVVLSLNVSDANKVQDIPLPGQCSRPISI